MSDIVLSFASLPKNVRHDLALAMGFTCEVEYLVLSNLKSHGYLSILKELWKKKTDKLTVYVNENGERPYGTVLALLSFVCRASKRSIVVSGKKAEPMNLATIGALLWRLSVAYISALFRIISISYQIRRLQRMTPRAPIYRDRGTIMFLKTNLWFGVVTGGAITHVKGVLGALLRKGWKVNLYEPETYTVGVKNSNLNVETIPFHQPYIIPRDINNFVFNRDFFNKFSNPLNCDVSFIYHRLSLGIFAPVLLARRMGVPLVLEYNGPEVWMAKNWSTPLTLSKLAKRVEGLCLKHADVIVTVSDALRTELVSERGLDPNKIVTYPNGADLDEPATLGSVSDDEEFFNNLGIEPSDVIVSFVGSFGPWHGASVLARAVKQIFEQDQLAMRYGELKFLFVGDGPASSEVEKTVMEYVNNGRVIFTGMVLPLKARLLIDRSSITVIPTVPNTDGSQFFGSPTKLFESMVLGKPVVASDLGQVGEILKDSPNILDIKSNGSVIDVGKACGVRVPPGDVLGTADAIRFMLDHEDWRIAAGKNCRQLISESYTWTHHVGAVLKKLQEVSVANDDARQVKRVLLNVIHSRAGGGLTYLSNMLHRLLQFKDLEIHIVATIDQAEFLQELGCGQNIHFIENSESWTKRQWSEQIIIPIIAKRMKADVVFSPANIAPIFCRKSVVLIRNSISVTFLERRFVKHLYWLALFLMTTASAVRSPRFMSVSSYAFRSTCRVGKTWLARKCTIVPHGVADYYIPPSNNMEREKFILMVSNIYVQKNMINMAIAFKDILKKFPDYKLVIAGSEIDKHYSNLLRNKIDELAISDAVQFRGSLSSQELVPLYQTCQVFAFPSFVETFGNPLLEAMACGAPIAASNAGAMPEVVGDAGVYFDPNDPHEMSECIIRLLEDENLRNTNADIGIDRAQRYSWDRTAENVADVLRLAAES
ncbi:glycosyltransferase [Rhodospirillales bacterium]|nr:glycosyltransferase [Rhodospirillales bacterium]